MQFVLRRPCPQAPGRPSGVPGWAATAGRAAVLLLVLGALVVCAACCGRLPVADARGEELGPGPSARAYPFAGERGPALDPWGFVERQCTSYVAWYLNAHGVPFGLVTRGPRGGSLFSSADSWDGAARAAGFTVRSAPAVGSIAQWDPGEASPAAPSTATGVSAAGDAVVTAGGYGHVAVVERVHADGSVLVSEYNGDDGEFHERVTRAPRYLYIGVPGDAAARTALTSR